MIILGIDPGLAIVGYGVVDYTKNKFTTMAYGAITTPPHTAVEDRLAVIYEKMTELISVYHPADMAIEELFFNTNTTTGISVAEARGVCLLAAKQQGINIFEYTPLQVKQSVVGYGRAEKKQVMMMTKTILGLEKMPRLDDTADALAIAVCHAHTGGSKVRSYYNLR